MFVEFVDVQLRRSHVFSCEGRSHTQPSRATHTLPSGDPEDFSTASTELAQGFQLGLPVYPRKEDISSLHSNGRSASSFAKATSTYLY